MNKHRHQSGQKFADVDEALRNITQYLQRIELQLKTFQDSVERKEMKVSRWFPFDSHCGMTRFIAVSEFIILERYYDMLLTLKLTYYYHFFDMFMTSSSRMMLISTTEWSWPTDTWSRNVRGDRPPLMLHLFAGLCLITISGKQTID